MAAGQTPSAASQSADEVRRNARGHVGPLYVTPGIQVKELGVDSNVFNEAVEPKSDFTATVAPKLDLALFVARRALLTAAVATDLVWYNRYETERSVDPQATVRAELYLHRLTLFARGRVSEHAAAPELRDRRPVAASRERARGRRWNTG